MTVNLRGMSLNDLLDVAIRATAAARRLEEQELVERGACPSWCDGTHPNPGGIGNTQHVVQVGRLRAIRSERYGERSKADHIMIDDSYGTDMYRTDALDELAADLCGLREVLGL